MMWLNLKMVPILVLIVFCSVEPRYLEPTTEKSDVSLVKYIVQSDLSTNLVLFKLLVSEK